MWTDIDGPTFSGPILELFPVLFWKWMTNVYNAPRATYSPGARTINVGLAQARPNYYDKKN